MPVAGYGFANVTMAAFDMNDPEAVVPQVTSDFTLTAKNQCIIDESEVPPVKEQLAQAMSDKIP